jgi:hypothetical protein
VAQIYLRALGSLSIASYDSLGYSGVILSRLHTEFFLAFVRNLMYAQFNECSICCSQYSPFMVGICAEVES